MSLLVRELEAKRLALEAENKRLRGALERIVRGFEEAPVGMFSVYAAVRLARDALAHGDTQPSTSTEEG